MGLLGSYANAVEKLHKDLDKNKSTLLKIERAGDVLTDAVSTCTSIFEKRMGVFLVSSTINSPYQSPPAEIYA